MYFQKLKYVIFACLAYVFYYICRFAAVWMLPSVGAVTQTVIGSLIFIGAAVGLRRALGDMLCGAVSLRRISVFDGAVLGFAGAAFNIVCVVALSLIPFPESWIAEYGEASTAIGASGAVLTVVFSVFIAPIAEELMFRGLLYGSLRCAIPKWIALTASAMLFGAVHGTAVWVIYAAFFGAVLAFIYEKYRSIAAPILFHMGFNLIGAVSSTVGLGDRFFAAAAVPSAAVIVCAGVYAVRKKR